MREILESELTEGKYMLRELYEALEKWLNSHWMKWKNIRQDFIQSQVQEWME